MVLAMVEHDGGTPADTSLEALALARDVAEQTGATLEAVAFGEGPGLTDHAGEHGVDALHVVEHDRLDAYAPQAWAESLSQLVDERGAGAVVAPGTTRGNETLAHVGARRDVSMAAGVIEVTAGETYELRRLRWGGSLIEQARLAGEEKLLTTAEGEIDAEPAPDPTDPAVEPFTPDLTDDHFRVRVERRETTETEGVPLGEARVVVGGGRGVGSAEDFDKLEELADELDGTVGASRAAVNEGWRPHDDQVGQTGTKISPELYVACGISGAVQHMVGCSGADNILAINTDPEAAIIGKCDYAVVADLHEVVPRVTEQLKNGE